MTDLKPEKADQVNTPENKPTTEATAKSTADPSPAVVVKKSSSGAAGVAVIFSLAALVASGFTWYQNQVSKVQNEASLAVGVSNIGGQVSRLGDSISSLQAQQNKVVSVDQLDNQITKLGSQLEASISEVSNRQNELDSSINKINSDLQKGVNAFMLDEVGQLLKLANHSAAFSSDSAAAIKALVLADAQLKEMSDPRYAVVRSQINQEIALLKNSKQADLPAISANLTAIVRIVPELPLANEPEDRPVEQAPVVNGQAEITWRTEVKKMWQDILNIVTIQRVDQPPKPLLAPDQRYFLNQNLQLNLTKAEVALLRNQPEIFAQGLDTAISWLTEYFDLRDSRVQSVVAQLEELKLQEIDTALPSIVGSYTALQTIKGE